MLASCWYSQQNWPSLSCECFELNVPQCCAQLLCTSANIFGECKGSFKLNITEISLPTLTFFVAFYLLSFGFYIQC